MAWNIQQFCGYVPKTTFWDDFTIADAFGVNAIIDTFCRAFGLNNKEIKRLDSLMKENGIVNANLKAADGEGWKSNVTYVTELVLVCNHKLWYFYEKNQDLLARVYDALWKFADEWCCQHLKGKDMEYYYSVTD